VSIWRRRTDKVIRASKHGWWTSRRRAKDLKSDSWMVDGRQAHPYRVMSLNPEHAWTAIQKQHQLRATAFFYFLGVD